MPVGGVFGVIDGLQGISWGLGGGDSRPRSGSRGRESEVLQMEQEFGLSVVFAVAWRFAFFCFRVSRVLKEPELEMKGE